MMEQAEIRVSKSNVVFVTGLNNDVIVGRAGRASDKFNTRLKYNTN